MVLMELIFVYVEAFRFTVNVFEREIKEKGVYFFSCEGALEILSNECFYLSLNVTGFCIILFSG